MPPTPPSNRAPSEKKFSVQSVFLAAVLIAGVGVAGYILFAETLGRASAAQSTVKLEDIPFDGSQAYTYLKQLCDFGPRRAARKPSSRSKSF